MHKQLLVDALDDALENGTFNKAVMVQKAANVCCFGLGTYFREAFASKHIKETWHVNLLSDNDSGKWGKSFEGIPCIPPTELTQYKDLMVILLLGDPRPVERQLDQLGIRHVTHVDLSIDDELGFTKDREEFAKMCPKFLAAYDLFEDEDSKRVYVNAIVNRISPTRSVVTWDDLCVEGEYFYQKFMNDNSGGGYS